jgi:hypothetical protein
MARTYVTPSGESHRRIQSSSNPPRDAPAWAFKLPYTAGVDRANMIEVEWPYCTSS